MAARRKQIFKFLHKQGTGVRLTLSTSTFFHEDDVHSFRTHVKKLRAFLHWLGRDKNRLPAAFREIYHISGELRDIQVLLHSLEESKEAPPAFIAWLKDNAGRLKELWDDTYHPRIIRRLEQQLRHPQMKKPTACRLQSFFNHGVDAIESVVYLPAPDDEEVHDMRKKLKEMYFVYDWGKDHDCASRDDATPEVLQKLGDDCGEFNDKRIAILLLNAYIQQEKDDTTRGTAMQLQQHWEEQRLDHKAQLLGHLREFVAAH